MRLSQDHIAVIQKEMSGLSGKPARQKALILASQFKIDVTRIYYYSKDVRPRRKQRADKGDIKFIEKDKLQQLAHYSIKYDFSADHIKEIAAANNMGEISPSSFNRVLRNMGLSRRQAKKDINPYISWEAPYPNALHQLDSTVAQQFYLDDDGSIGYEPPEQRYKNKPGNRKPRITMLALRDDYSRSIFARFFLGNHTFAWMEFLYQAWSVKLEDPAGFPFHGLPKFLYSDNDTVIKSKKFRRAMDRLNVKLMSHEVGNSRAKGKIEVAFKLLQEFEKVSKIHKWQTLDQANADLFDYLYYVNNRIHSITRQPSFERWRTIKHDHLQEMPNESVFKMLHMDVWHRQIRKDMTVSLHGKIWQLPFRTPFINHIGKMAEMYSYPGETDSLIMLLDGKEYEVPYADKKMRGLGRHDALPTPAALEMRQKITTANDPELKLTGFYKDRHRRIYLPAEGEQFDEHRIASEPTGIMRTRLWFINLLQHEFLINTPPTNAEKAWIESIFQSDDAQPETLLRQQLQLLIAGKSNLNCQQATG